MVGFLWIFLLIFFNKWHICETQSNAVCPERPDGWKQLLGERRCRKKCISDEDCGKKVKKCLCDGQCGLSCINPTARCHALLDIPNGWLTPPENWVFGQKAFYGCGTGYFLVGSSERVCQGNREWSGPRPQCRANAKCVPPPDIPYAQNNAPPGQNEFDLDTFIYYSCISGYYRFNSKGLQKAKCMVYNGTAQWFGPDMQCQARSCGNPGELLNGIREGKVFQYPHSVRYRCVNGFELLGSAVRKCQANGQWSGEESQCKPVACPKPADPLNGRVLGTSLSFQSRITYSCKEGFRIVGQAQRVCQADQSWSGHEAICEEIRCKSIGPLWNGYIDGDQTKFDSVVIFRCLEGMTHLGPHHTKCLRDGSWSNPLPKCMAPCPVPSVSNGNIERWTADQMVYHGERIQVNCDRNHELSYPEFPLCHNGTWSNIPYCIPIRCKKWPPKVRNSNVIFTKSNHNATAKYKCHSGYKIKGSDSIRCLFGKWHGQLPTCELKICPHPKDAKGDLRNGVIMIEGTMGTYEYAPYIRSVSEGRMIIYQCNKGYSVVGPPKATCVNGTWQPGIMPRCVPKKHPQMEGSIKWEAINGRIKRSLIRATAQDYFISAGGSNAMSPRRERRSPLSNPGDYSSWHAATNNFLRANVLTSRARLRGENRYRNKYNAETDPHLSGGGDEPGEKKDVISAKAEHREALAVQRERRQDQMENGESAMCPPLYDNVRQLFAVIHQKQLDNGYFPDRSRLAVICRQGFHLPMGQDGSLVCRGGQWTPEVPNCIPKFCILPQRPNAYFLRRGQIMQPGEVIAHRDGARLVCLRGHMLTGNDVLECHLGKFVKLAGECSPSDCPLPYLPHGEYLIQPLSLNVSHGSEIQFTCGQRMYPRPSDGNIFCAFGDIRPHAPECNPEASPVSPLPPDMGVGCLRPLDIDRAWVYRQHEEGNELMATLIDPYQDVYPNNTVVHYKCKENGTQGNDQAVAVRCIQGEWIAQLMACASSADPPTGVSSNSTNIRRIQETGLKKLPCTEPVFSSDAAIIGQHPGVLEVLRQNGFPHGTRLDVKCLFNLRNSSAPIWTIKCRRGEWKRLDRIQCYGGSEIVAASSHHAPEYSCRFSPSQFPYVRAFSPERGEALKFDDSLPNESKLHMRCEHVGMYQFRGSRELVCSNGTWHGRSPRCIKLSPDGNLHLPPPIFYRVKDGHLGVSDKGELVIRRSSTLLLECLYPKGRGKPEWHTTTVYRDYPKTWSSVTLTKPWDDNEETPERWDSFTLTVAVAQNEDSGVFHCVLPNGYRQTLRLKVQDVECNALPLVYNNTVMRVQSSNTDKYYMGTVLQFLCGSGYRLQGASNLYCMETGHWSHSMPNCVPIMCPSLTLSHPALSAQTTTRSYQGVTRFMCASGYSVSGPTQIHCLNTGHWSDPVPTCRGVSCPTPDLPSGAILIDRKSNYTYGDVVLFKCSAGYMMAGRDFAVCSNRGTWDGPVPECLPYCRYPQLTEHLDTTSAPKDYYLVGERLVYFCKPNDYRLQGEAVLECRPSSTWSSQPPKCVPRRRRRARLRTIVRFV